MLPNHLLQKRGRDENKRGKTLMLLCALEGATEILTWFFFIQVFIGPLGKKYPKIFDSERSKIKCGQHLGHSCWQNISYLMFLAGYVNCKEFYHKSVQARNSIEVWVLPSLLTCPFLTLKFSKKFQGFFVYIWHGFQLIFNQRMFPRWNKVYLEKRSLWTFSSISAWKREHTL